METVSRSLSPVMVSMREDFYPQEKLQQVESATQKSSFFNLGNVLRAASKTTQVLIISMMAATILSIPLISSVVVYQSSDPQASVAVISHQEVPASSHEVVPVIAK